MQKIKGHWKGEYTINNGTEENPEISYFHFSLKLNGDNDAFRGQFTDKTLNTKKSEVNGFEEEGFISFVRTASYEPELCEFLHFDQINEEKKLEFIFNGNYVEKDEAYIGVWEVAVNEERIGFQENIDVESRTGGWYMRK